MNSVYPFPTDLVAAGHVLVLLEAGLDDQSQSKGVERKRSGNHRIDNSDRLVVLLILRTYIRCRHEDSLVRHLPATGLLEQLQCRSDTLTGRDGIGKGVTG